MVSPEFFLVTAVIIERLLKLGVPLFELVLDDIELGAAFCEAEFVEGPKRATSKGATHAAKSFAGCTFMMELLQCFARFRPRWLRAGSVGCTCRW